MTTGNITKLSENQASSSPATSHYFVTAWCDRPYYAQCEVQANSPEEALAKARIAILDEPAEECDDGFDWDEWRVDSADAEGVLRHSDRCQTAVQQELLAALNLAEGRLEDDTPQWIRETISAAIANAARLSAAA